MKDAPPNVKGWPLKVKAKLRAAPPLAPRAPPNRPNCVPRPPKIMAQVFVITATLSPGLTLKYSVESAAIRMAVATAVGAGPIAIEQIASV